MKIDKNTILFSRTTSDAIVPSKRIEDAGYDLYACFPQQEIRIDPGQIVIIPTGIAMGFNESYVFIVKERGSTGSIGLAVRMGVVDSGYRGELKIGINNTSLRSIIITKDSNALSTNEILYYPYNKAIAQGILLVIPEVSSQEIPYDKLKSYQSERMDTLLGASGK